ncbi:LysR family transcriptional regulator [Dactylosporangium sp. NPDC049525]|uniref:LysR family transcriptional regulator n=1 Tax=Dactylosporangium sp. NPDC049525 TaxID=3154730 RepID=UPI0034236692
MHERELRAFTSIAQIGRMDLAAKALGYSQPALSYQLKRLETTLGATLFTRDSTGTKLTVTGQVILPTAQATLALIESMKQAAGAVDRHAGRLADTGW